MFRMIMLVSAAVGLAGCQAFPAQGPMGVDIRNDVRAQAGFVQEDEVRFEVVPLTANVVEALERRRNRDLAGTFTDRRPAPGVVLGSGDVISLTIFEATAGGLFIPEQAGVRPGNFVQLPDMTVDNNGNIGVPYAGIVRAAGRSIQQVQDEIVQRLRNRAIEPQVVITLRESRANQVSVLGDVRSSLRFPLLNAADRVLDGIARAGGPAGPGHSTFVTLQRDGQQATVPFLTLVRQPQNNIFLRPRDVLHVFSQGRTFVAFGATGQNGNFTFDVPTLTLAEGVGRAGGLIDDRADPGAVFLYRLEDRAVVERLGVDMRRWGDEQQIPVVYSINFRDPAAFFLARRFEMQNRDLIYISNAAAVEYVKFINVLRLSIATVREGNAVRRELPN